jgi:hypothetical protein
MHILGIIASLLGILTALLTLFQAVRGAWPFRNPGRERFQRMVRDWIESDYSSIPSHEDFRRTFRHIRHGRLSEQDLAFSLLCALQHGDPMLRDLIVRNRRNTIAVSSSVPFLSSRGVRVGWRTEYALSRLDQSLVEPALLRFRTDPLVTDPQGWAAMTRVLEGSVIDHLRQQASGPDPKMRAYAQEVLRQIGVDEGGEHPGSV